jgi:hypothetical protein
MQNEGVEAGSSEYAAPRDLGGGTLAYEFDNPQQVVDRLFDDPEFFFAFFLNENRTLPSPPCHYEIFHEMTDLTHAQYVCAIPRDHAKTTIAKLAVMRLIIFTKFRFFTYFSDTHTLAASALLDIVHFMETDQFRAVFGENAVDWLIRRESEGTYIFRFLGRKIIMKAFGAGQQIRGMNIDNVRPDVGVFDDIETNESVESAAQLRKLIKWFYGPVKKAFNKTGYKLIHIGNMISNNCLLKKHCESTFWHSTRYGCLLSNGQPLWPEAWPIEKLREDFRSYVEVGEADTWFAEMMNMPVSGSNGLLRGHDIQHSKVMPGWGEFGFITIDPAISKKKGAHKSAIVVHMWYEDCWHVVDYHHEQGMTPVDTFQKMVEFCYKWGVNVIGIESVAYQASLIYVFDHFCMLYKIHGLKFVPCPGGVRKVERLRSWAGAIKKGIWKLMEGDFTMVSQLLTYQPLSENNDDDLIDAAAHGVNMIELYMREIEETISIPLTSNAVSGYQMVKS